MSFVARTCFLSNTTIALSSHKGPTAKREELWRFGKFVAVQADSENLLEIGSRPCFEEKSVELSGKTTAVPLCG